MATDVSNLPPCWCTDKKAYLKRVYGSWRACENEIIPTSRRAKYLDPDYDPRFTLLRKAIVCYIFDSIKGKKREYVQRTVYDGTPESRDKAIQYGIEHDRLHPETRWCVMFINPKGNIYRCKIYMSLEELFIDNLYGKKIMVVTENIRAFTRIFSADGEVCAVLKFNKEGNDVATRLREQGFNERGRPIQIMRMIIRDRWLTNPGKKFMDMVALHDKRKRGVTRKNILDVE